MILDCPSCSARLTLDEAKVPPHAFTMRCGKCGNIINAQPPPATSGDAPQVNAGSHVATTVSVSSLASSVVAPQADARPSADETMRLLTQFLRDAVNANQERSEVVGNGGSRWETRRALICVQPEHAEQIASVFNAKGYEVFTASDATSAIKRMREERPDVILLAPEFDPVEQGALFISREISAQRLPERRRLFVIQISATARTSDAHAAFVNSVNLVVNAAELDRLPDAFDRAARAYKELYYDFNKSFRAAVR